MKARRALIVLLVPAFIVGALAAERVREDDAAPPEVHLERMMPVVAAPGAQSGTWFCAAGTAAGPDGIAEQLVVLENAASEARRATLTAYGDEGQRASQVVDLPAASRTQVPVTSLLTAAWAGVLVEVDGGEVAVQHVLTGPAGRAAGPCASSVSPTWYLPTGTTVLGVAHHLVLFNPFPDEAVVDLTFETETDTRTPPELQGLVVPGGSVEVVDVSAVVTVREQLATQVVARSGLVVAEQVEVVGEDSDLPAGIAALLGAPTAAPTWYLPAGPPLADGRSVAVVVYNPGDSPAEVDVQVLIDDAAQQGMVEPFEVTVRPGQFEVVDLRQDERVPLGVGWAAYAQSRNDVPVVAARVIRTGGEAEPKGLATTLGSPLMATRWEVPLGSLAEVGPVQLAVVNPTIGDPATVSVSALRDGTSAAVASAQDVAVPPGARAVLDLSALGDGAGASLRIDASGPVVVEVATTFAAGKGFSSWIAAPVDGTLALLPLAVTDVTTSPTVVLDGVPVDTAPAGTSPPGTGPAAGQDGAVATTSPTTAAPSSTGDDGGGSGGTTP